MTDLTCAELVELVTEYLEGALPSAERLAFEAHLAACAGCAQYIEQLRYVTRLTGALAEQPVSDATRAELLRLVRSWKIDQSPP